MRLGAEGDNISDVNIQPPDVEIRDGKPVLSRDSSRSRGEGAGGWISNIAKRGKGEGGSRGRYGRVGQSEDDR